LAERADIAIQDWREKNPKFAKLVLELVTLAMTRYLKALGNDEVFRLYRIRNRDTLFTELRHKVFTFHDPEFVSALQKQNPGEDVTFRYDLIRLIGLWFLIDSLMGYGVVTQCCDPAAYDLGVVVTGLVQPYLERWKAEQVQTEREKRVQQFASPDKALESRTDLSAYKKASVFQDSLIARNHMGYLERSGHLHEHPLEFHPGIPRGARRFFEANPHLSVADVNRVLDHCLEVAHTWCNEDDDPYSHARKGGEQIGYFLIHFGTIINELGMTSEFPGLRCFSSQELFGKEGAGEEAEE